jgi:3-dehydroquinate synthase
VEKDFTEKNYRKILNFGHTFGHALESISLTKKRQNLSHGMAVTQGMILETFLSFLYGKIQETHMMDIIHELDKHLHPPPLRVQAEEMFHYMKQDKKNKHGKILSVGISEPGKPCLDIEVSKKDIQQCIKMYHAWKKPFN